MKILDEAECIDLGRGAGVRNIPIDQSVLVSVPCKSSSERMIISFDEIPGLGDVCAAVYIVVDESILDQVRLKLGLVDSEKDICVLMERVSYIYEIS